MELTDTHTHTWYSGHGRGTPEEVVAAAEARSFTTIAITEHLHLPAGLNPRGEFAMRAEQEASYLAEVEAARLAHPGVEVIRGVEVDWRGGAADWILEALHISERADGSLDRSACPYELILGSVHMLPDANEPFWAFDYAPAIDGWAARGSEQVWREYLALWLEMVASRVPFDVMSHPDLPKKLGFKPEFDAREMWREMAEAAAARGVLIECNCSGLFYPVGEVYPGPELLQAFFEAGVPATVSSDAHAPEQLGRGIEAGWAALRQAGYRELTLPTRAGGRRKIPLD